ncbi:MAG: branched-chain amino acid ABC transporter permease [Nitrososphaerota archaeon]
MSAYILRIFTFCGVYVILAVGLDLLMGYSGQISVGHASFFAVGAYISAICVTKYGMSPIVGTILGMVLSGILAYVIGRPVLALREYYLAMATLALNEIIINLIIGFESITGGASGIRDIPPYGIFGFSFSTPISQYFLIWGVTLFVIRIVLWIVNSPLCRILLAIHSDEIAAQASGIDPRTYKTRIFVIVNVFAALAGSLYAHSLGYIAPDDFSVATSVNILVMLYLGGLRTVWGALIGAIFLKLLAEITYYFRDYELLINGAILVSILLFLPEGLVGVINKLKSRIKAKEVTMRMSHDTNY